MSTRTSLSTSFSSAMPKFHADLTCYAVNHIDPQSLDLIVSLSILSYVFRSYLSLYYLHTNLPMCLIYPSCIYLCIHQAIICLLPLFISNLFSFLCSSSGWMYCYVRPRLSSVRSTRRRWPCQLHRTSEWWARGSSTSCSVTLLASPPQRKSILQ